MQNSKKPIIMLVVISLLLCLSLFAQAATQRIILQIDSRTCLVDDREVLLDTAPYIREGRTMVPLRMVADSFGYVTRWDASLRKVTIIGEGTVIELVIGQSVVTVNGEMMYIDGSAVISTSGQTMVPIRFISEIMGYRVDWNSVTRVITIMTPLPVVTGTPSERTEVINREVITGTIDINISSPSYLSSDRQYLDTVGKSEGLHIDLYRQTISNEGYAMDIMSFEILGNINPTFEAWINEEYRKDIERYINEFLVNNAQEGFSKDRLTIKYTVYTNGRVISILSEVYENSNPRAIELETRTFDVLNGVELKLENLFIAGVDARPTITRILNQTVAQVVTANASINPVEVPHINRFLVIGDKLAFVYAPFELSRDYASIVQINIPYSSLRNYLKLEYFGEYVILLTQEERIQAIREAEAAERARHIQDSYNRQSQPLIIDFIGN